MERVLGRLGRAGPGEPTLVVVGGVHGNEPAGVEASQRVSRALASREDLLRGEVVFVAGNLQALALGRRFVDRDLNRAWTTAGVAALLERQNGVGAEQSAEDAEQRELLTLLDGILDTAEGPVFCLDLHTTSGTGGAFSTVADTLRNREVALALPVPLVLGLEELVEGTLHEYLGTRGCITLAFESGQHAESAAVDRAEAGIWIILAATGLALESDLPEVAPSRAELARDSVALPRVLEMRYRHAVGEDDAFRMRPNYANFQLVERGEAVADDRHGPVRLTEDARLLMPLYQAQGQDGFFLVREFSAFWLTASRALRAIGFGRFVHWLPGIRLHPSRADALIVNRRVARFYALQVLHLLGYRRELDDGETLVVLRQSHRE
jgi:succinylglutamate desuccinylase